ncbi:MAG: metallopeptidase TldD-related protein [Patescibacteria group bacterium]|nr:hypothetical protein [Patescibacteria group bacterium]
MNNLQKYLKKTKEVRNYRLSVYKNDSLSIGIYGQSIGGAYAPISNSSKISGDLLIEWTDGNISKTSITSANLENPERTVLTAREVSITDEYSKTFLDNYRPKNKTLQYSKELKKIQTENQDFVVDQLRKIKDIEASFGVKSFETDILASISKTQVINSKGLELADSFSSYTLQSSLESRFFFTLSSRSPLEISAYSASIELLGKLFRASDTSVKVKQKEKIAVILSPEAAWSLLSFFVINNLRGSLVANRLSRFSKEDFKDQKKILPPWFTLCADSQKEMTPGAANFTSEGVENEKATFIKNGQLKTPVLDLKHSQKLGLPPTSLITGPYTTSFVEKDTKVDALEKRLNESEQAVFIPYFLGMHTQNQTTGDYSLPAPYAIYIKNGKLRGTIKVIITGNIFVDLANNVKFTKWDLFPQPGICFNPNVIIEG